MVSSATFLTYTGIDWQGNLLLRTEIQSESPGRAKSFTVPAVHTVRSIFILYLREMILINRTYNARWTNLYTNTATRAAILIDDNLSH